LSPVRGETIELCPHSPEFLLLLRGQVLPGFHPPQHLLLAVGRHGVEPLQALFKSLLAFRRETAKLRITLERASLLVRRETAIAIEPLSRMMPLVRGFVAAVFPLRRRLKLRLLTLKLRARLPRWRSPFRALGGPRLEMWRSLL